MVAVRVIAREWWSICISKVTGMNGRSKTSFLRCLAMHMLVKCNEQRAMGDRRRATGNKQWATGDEHEPTANGRWVWCFER